MKKIIIVLFILLSAGFLFAEETVDELVVRFIERIEFATEVLVKQTGDLEALMVELETLEAQPSFTKEDFMPILEKHDAESPMTSELLETTWDDVDRIKHITAQFLTELFNSLVLPVSEFEEAYVMLEEVALTTMIKILTLQNEIWGEGGDEIEEDYLLNAI